MEGRREGWRKQGAREEGGEMRVQGRRERDAEPWMDLRLQPLGGRGGWEVKRGGEDVEGQGERERGAREGEMDGGGARRGRRGRGTERRGDEGGWMEGWRREGWRAEGQG